MEKNEFLMWININVEIVPMKKQYWKEKTAKSFETTKPWCSRWTNKN